MVVVAPMLSKVRVRLELEAAKQSICTDHVDELSIGVHAHRLELPLSLEFFVVFCRANFCDAVAIDFL